MLMPRRTFIGAAASALALSATPVLAGSSTRRFVAVLGRKQVGDSYITLSRRGSDVTAEVHVSLDIRILGLIRYRYELNNVETWRNGVLQEMRSTTDNNGTPAFVNAHRVDGGLQVDGSAYQGLVTGNPATTSYFTPDFLSRSTWISTQSGRVMDLTIRNAGSDSFPTNEGELPSTRYTLRGRQDIDLYYDSNYEWIGSSFKVVGRTARVQMSERGRSFNAIWQG